MATRYTAHGPLIYLAYVPALLVVVMFAGADSLPRPRPLRIALISSAVVLFAGVLASVATDTVGPAISGAAPFAFLLWHRAVAPSFSRLIGRAPIVTGPGTQSWVWWDVVYTWVLVAGAAAIGACSMLVLDWWGPVLQGPPPGAV